MMRSPSQTYHPPKWAPEPARARASQPGSNLILEEAQSWRPRMGLPPLDLGRADLVQTEAVLVDRVRSTLSLPIAFSDEAAVTDFEAAIIAHGAHGEALFKEPRSRLAFGREFEIAGGWALSGKATLRLQGLRGHLVLDLNLNPTRFVAGLPWEATAVTVRQMSPATALRLPTVTTTALDGNTNALGLFGSLNKPGRPEMHPQVRAFPELLAAYIDAVERLLRDQLQPASLAGRVDITAPRLRSAMQAEAYAEFHARDAITVVEALRVAAVASAADTQWRSYVGGGLERNCASVFIPLGKTVSCAIYAKTERRIRFEIRYSGDIREHVMRRSQRGTETVLHRTLLALRSDAVRRLNTFVRGLSMHAEPITKRVDFFDFTTELHKATDSVKQFRTMLSLLGNHGGVTETIAGGAAPPSVCTALVRAGVLFHVRVRDGNVAGPRRYTLTLPYAAAVVAALRAIGDTPSALFLEATGAGPCCPPAATPPPALVILPFVRGNAAVGRFVAR